MLPSAERGAVWATQRRHNLDNLKTGLLLAALLTVAHGASAQQAPRGGGQLQQIPVPPTPTKASPDLRVVRPAETVPTTKSSPKFRMSALRVSGASLFPETELIAAAGFTGEVETSLPELQAMAARIAKYYNARGYFVAQAYLPAQDIKDGKVTIAVVEGRYGAVAVRNEARLSDGVVGPIVRGLDPGDPVASKPLQRRLLLLSDIPGVVVRSVLAPGAAVGTSDLSIALLPGRRLSGSLEADNAGNRYTGVYRVGGTLNLNNPTGHGDLASLRLLTSIKGLDYGRASYQAPLGLATAGAAYARVHYQLGREFSPLGARGTADIASLYASYPLIRSHESNLYALAHLDAKRFKDKIELTSSSAKKRSLALRLGLAGDAHDDWGGGGRTDYGLGWTHGELDLRDPATAAVDRLTARTDGGYDKFDASLSRLQTLRGPLSLYAAARGQAASGNLDISEKMELGGAYGVRAYPEGEAYGDQGYVLTLEARLRLPTSADRLPGAAHLFAFADTGYVTFAKSRWAPGPNHATRSGAGVGVSWALANNFVVKATYAHTLGHDATTASGGSSRAWIQLAKLF